MSARRGAALAACLFLLAAAVPILAADPRAPGLLRVTWYPPAPRPGEAAWIYVQGAPAEATVTGSVSDRPLLFFPYGTGHAAIAGFDIDLAPGAVGWRVAAVVPGVSAMSAEGSVVVGAREFRVQHLTLPPAMVDLAPQTERRALEESARLRAVLAAITPDRLWRGRFTRPVVGSEPGSGFGARRIINGKPRAPHGGADYAAPAGTPVVAANDGRVALVGEFFFPGRLVVLDHGLGLYTLYFHLERYDVREGDRVTRGQPIGRVGATGRATGPHLHFGVQVGLARVDPDSLLGLAFVD